MTTSPHQRRGRRCGDGSRTNPSAKARVLYEARRTRVPIAPFTVVAWLANVLGKDGITLAAGHLVGPVTIRVAEGA